MLTAVSLYRAQGSAGAWVSTPEGGRHATATSSGQQLPKECRPSSDPARCPCRPLGPPATVTTGRLLVSPVSLHKGRTNWLLSPPPRHGGRPPERSGGSGGSCGSCGSWWQLVAVGGSWWQLVAVGGSWWQLVAVGGSWWQLVVVGGS